MTTSFRELDSLLSLSYSFYCCIADQIAKISTMKKSGSAFASGPLLTGALRRHVGVAEARPMHKKHIITSLQMGGQPADVLSTQDIVVGTILALVLAFGYSFLNGQSSSTSFISWPSQSGDMNDAQDISSPEIDVVDDKVFNEQSWEEMSREENYVLYNTRIRQRSEEISDKTSLQNVNKKENKLVLTALLILFVPIFSAEFFFALSRLFICEMGMGGDLVEKMCSPILGSV